MDLSTLTLSKTTDVEIYAPDGSPTDIVITVYSKHSNEFKSAAQQLINKAPKNKNAPTDLRRAERDSVKLLTNVTVSWKNVEHNGKSVECTKENVEEIYTAHPWLRSQIDDAIGDDANFMTA